MDVVVDVETECLFSFVCCACVLYAAGWQVGLFWFFCFLVGLEFRCSYVMLGCKVMSLTFPSQKGFQSPKALDVNKIKNPKKF